MNIELRSYQKIAVDVLTKKDRGLLVAPTGSGKTKIMTGLWDKHKPKTTIVIVPTSALVKQTIDSFEGSLGQAVMSSIDVSTWQGLHANRESIKQYDMVLADESHRVGEETNYYDIIKIINPKYMYAVTATPMRYDSIRPLEKLCNEHKHIIPIDLLYQQNFLVRPTIKFVKTGFHYDVNNILTNFERQNFSFEQKLGRLKSYIGTDQERNNFLINYINNISFNCALILSYTTEQTERLYEAYKPKNMFEQKHMIHGKLGVKAKREFFETIDKQTNFVIFATQSFLGEGFDLPKLDTLFLATPFGGGAKTIQFAGRVLRIFPGKTFVNIYDFEDDFGELGEQWANSRRKRYDLLQPKYEEEQVIPAALSMAAKQKKLKGYQRDFEIKFNWLEKQSPEVQAQYVDQMLALNFKIRTFLN